jgi:hypothetical protein
MLQIDPWEKAAECERYLQAEVDSTRREILTNVRDLWIGLANARNFLTGPSSTNKSKPKRSPGHQRRPHGRRPPLAPFETPALLALEFRGYHHWQDLTPPPASYCATMREGEVAMKELARLAACRAILYRQPGLAYACRERATCSATRSTRRRRSISRPVSRSPSTPVRRHQGHIPHAPTCSGSSSKGCPLVGALLRRQLFEESRRPP